MDSLKLHRYLFMEQSQLPPMPGPLVYVVAGNGVFLWGKRDGLEALVPVAKCRVRGLFPVVPFVRLDGELPRIAASFLERMLVIGGSARRKEDNVPVETLFFLSKQSEPPYWHLWLPAQHQEPCQVAPIKELLDPVAYSRVLMEIHTHPQPNMSAFYSCADNEEQRGFRLDGVMGRFAIGSGGKTTAEIRMRVVIFDAYNAAYEFPASWVLELPRGLVEHTPRMPSVQQDEENGGSNEQSEQN